MFPDVRDMHEMAGLRKHAFGHDGVNMGMPMDQITECLHRPDHCRNAAVAVYLKLEYIADRIVGCPAQLTQQFSVIPEVNS